MQCPKCNSGFNSRDFKVIDVGGDVQGITRRRVCNKCRHRFSTFEYIGAAPESNGMNKIRIKASILHLLRDL